MVLLLVMLFAFASLGVTKEQATKPKLQFNPMLVMLPASQPEPEGMRIALSNDNGVSTDTIPPAETLDNLAPKKPESTQEEIHRLKVKKCLRIIQTFYNYSGRANFSPHVDYFISYHEQLEQEWLAKGEKRAAGFGETWWWSLVYGGANFSMTCYGVAPGNCAGPLDVKHYPLVLDPKANIRHHTQEMFGYYLHNGVRGINLCEWVMYPARPFDWGGGMFAKTNYKHTQDIMRAYKLGKL